jgi:hypothetical protein
MSSQPGSTTPACSLLPCKIVHIFSFNMQLWGLSASGEHVLFACHSACQRGVHIHCSCHLPSAAGSRDQQQLLQRVIHYYNSKYVRVRVQGHMFLGVHGHRTRDAETRVPHNDSCFIAVAAPFCTVSTVPGSLSPQLPVGSSADQNDVVSSKNGQGNPNFASFGVEVWSSSVHASAPLRPRTA